MAEQQLRVFYCPCIRFMNLGNLGDRREACFAYRWDYDFGRCGDRPC